MKTTESSSNPDLQSWILDFLSEPNKVVEVKKFEGFDSLDKDLANWNKEVIIYEFEDTPYLPSFAFALLPVYHDRYPEFIFRADYENNRIIIKPRPERLDSGLS